MSNVAEGDRRRRSSVAWQAKARSRALGAPFYKRPVLEVAEAMLGCVVRHGPTAGVIVETEAYHDSEAACHAHVGVTPRTHILFGPPGRAYVYRSYGIHALLNAVCEREGVGAAVLIRALEPLEGRAAMARRRGVAPEARRLASGPGNLTRALGISLRDNGAELTRPPLTIEPAPAPRRFRVATGPRIGITRAVELPLRFWIAGHPGVSR